MLLKETDDRRSRLQQTSVELVVEHHENSTMEMDHIDARSRVDTRTSVLASLVDISIVGYIRCRLELTLLLL